MDDTYTMKKLSFTWSLFRQTIAMCFYGVPLRMILTEDLTSRLHSAKGLVEGMDVNYLLANRVYTHGE